LKLLAWGCCCFGSFSWFHNLCCCQFKSL
jgi:hypothetical protein